MSAPPADQPAGDRRADSAPAGEPAAREDAEGDVAALRDRISELESELDRKEIALDRKDAELAAVRRQYESILEDRAAEDEPQSGLLSLLR